MTFTHNLTVIQGDSATGKTTLVDMVQEYLLNGSDTGISLVCDVPCRVIAGNTWQEQLRGIENSIVFIDEGNRFISSDDFSKAVCGSSNYYVIVTREALDNLPYSVTEIYGIKSSGKYRSLGPVYHHMYRIYSDIVFPQKNLNVLVTEDTNRHVRRECPRDELLHERGRTEHLKLLRCRQQTVRTQRTGAFLPWIRSGAYR
jgi:hypothetical protein